MGDRASSQPEFTNGNPSDSDAGPDEEVKALQGDMVEDDANVSDN